MTKFLLSFIIAFLSFAAAAQSTNVEPGNSHGGDQQSMDAREEGLLTISSSILCEMCKHTLENGLAYVSGIKSTKVDVDNNTITVKYKPKKITEAEVKTKITELGYVADDMKPSKEAYDKLDNCCKKGGVCNE